MMSKARFIVCFVCMIVSCLAQPDDSEYAFLGRYVQWNNGKIYPGANTTPTDIQDYFTSSFNIPFLISKTLEEYPNLIIGDAPLNKAIEEAANTWNSSGISLPNLTYATLSDDGGYHWGYIGYGNVILIDYTNLSGEFAAPPSSLSSAKLAVTQPWHVEASIDCSNTEWGGPVIVGADIAISPYIDFFGGSAVKAGRYSMYTVALHELGHLMGLNHHRTVNINDVMFYSVEKSKERQILKSRDIGAINRLYGYDGMNNPANPAVFSSSIDCESFNLHMVHLLGIESDGTGYGDGSYGNANYNGDGQGYIDPCLNCLKDDEEEGIDCGGSCKPCLGFCNGNSLIRIFNEPEKIRNYEVVKEHIVFDSPNDPVTIEGGEVKVLKAGKFIEIKNEFDVKYQAIADFVIGNCECPDICEPILPNVITPDCNGEYDFLTFNVNGVNEWEISIWDRNGSLVFEGKGTTWNNFIVAWNGIANRGLFGSGKMVASGQYSYILRLTSSCDGSSKEFSRSMAVLPGRDSEECMKDAEPPTKSILNREGKQQELDVKLEDFISLDTRFDIFPNPSSSGLFTVKCQVGIIEEWYIVETNGNVVLTGSENTSSMEINLSKQPKGTYILSFKAMGKWYQEELVRS